MRAAAFSAILLAATANEAAFAQQPLSPGQVLSGEVRLVRTRHPSGTRISAYQLVTSTSYLLANDEFCDKDQPLKTFHLVTMDNPALADELKRSVGKSRRVKVIDPMCSHTAWHIGDAVLMKWEFQGK